MVVFFKPMVVFFGPMVVLLGTLKKINVLVHPHTGCTTKVAEHIQAFLGKPGLLNTKLAIRVKRFHEAHLK